MTTRGSVGNVAFYDEDIIYNNIRINSGMIIIRSNDVLRQKSLYYILKSNFVKKQISDMISGTVQKQLPVSIIKKILVPVENIDIEIIYNIDKKIKNNNAINVELEGMAKTIYDYWFLQFDFPNEEGKPYKSSGGKMIWNEELKREIPEGWEVKTLEDIENNIVTGKTPSTTDSTNFDGDIPFITIGDIRNNIYILATEQKLSLKGANTQINKYLPENSICV